MILLWITLLIYLFPSIPIFLSIQFHLSTTQRGFQRISCSKVFPSNIFLPQPWTKTVKHSLCFNNFSCRDNYPSRFVFSVTLLVKINYFNFEHFSYLSQNLDLPKKRKASTLLFVEKCNRTISATNKGYNSALHLNRNGGKCVSRSSYNTWLLHTWVCVANVWQEGKKDCKGVLSI